MIKSSAKAKKTSNVLHSFCAHTTCFSGDVYIRVGMLVSARNSAELGHVCNFYFEPWTQKKTNTKYHLVSYYSKMF